MVDLLKYFHHEGHEEHEGVTRKNKKNSTTDYTDFTDFKTKTILFRNIRLCVLGVFVVRFYFVSIILLGISILSICKLNLSNLSYEIFNIT
jgi:hypothetical protein